MSRNSITLGMRHKGSDIVKQYPSQARIEPWTSQSKLRTLENSELALDQSILEFSQKSCKCKQFLKEIFH